MNQIDISIVVALFNEEAVFHILFQRLIDVINNTSFSCEVILINDGSHDKTDELIVEACKKDPRFTTGVLLSRNHGHQLAVSAGLTYVRGKRGAMIIDGDLQDPPELVTEFYALLNKGFDVIYAIRKNRKESFLKKIAYSTYYRLQKKISSFNIPIDSGGFSMLSRRVVDNMNAMPEQSRYLRGMRAWVGLHEPSDDVTAYFKSTLDLSNSGFSSRITLDKLPPGKYQFAIQIINNVTHKEGLVLSDKFFTK